MILRPGQAVREIATGRVGSVSSQLTLTMPGTWAVCFGKDGAELTPDEMEILPVFPADCNGRRICVGDVIRGRNSGMERTVTCVDERGVWVNDVGPVDTPATWIIWRKARAEGEAP